MLPIGMRKKKLSLIAVLLLLAVPSFAVFNEKDLGQTTKCKYNHRIHNCSNL